MIRQIEIDIQKEKQIDREKDIQIKRGIRDLYGIDGIDLDIEEGAGSKKAAGPNMLYFIKYE